MSYINTEKTWHELLTAITIKRQELVNTGMRWGFTDDRTIKCSCELDTLLNLKEQYNHANHALKPTG